MRSILLSLLVLSVAVPALAVKTSHWTHTTEADFKQGTFKNVVTTNLGDLKLSREVKTLLGQDARVSAVYALAQAPDGTIYAGTGPEGVLLAIKDDKVTTAADLGQHTNLYSVLIDSKGRVLIGTGGEKGEIYRIDKAGEKPKSIFSSDDVQYVWSMVQTSDGLIYAATGPNGQLIQINADDSNKVLLDSDENNLLCMIGDGKDELFVGTDPNGLVMRVNRKSGELFVVYDAPESEISSLLRDGHGNLYAATSEASDSDTTTDDSNGTADQVGRPEAEQHGVPIPSNPPANPKPPEVPGPGPGEPLPIPKNNTVKPMSMMVMAEPGGDEPAPSEPKPGSPATAPARANARRSGAVTLPNGVAAGSDASSGNAIYRIDPDGFVTEIFRQPASVFAMLEQNGSILVATGNDGELYQVNPAAEETLVLAKVDPKDVMCLLPAKDGRIFMGLANSGDVATLASGFATDGNYTSPVLDATQISRFGKMQLRGTLPQGTAIKIATRSGNVEEASAPGWSKWSEELSASEFLQVPSPAARFLQYRLVFSSDGGKSTPVIEDVDVAYQVPNQSPQVKSVKVTPVASSEANTSSSSGSEDRGNAQPSSKVTITWEATDPNEDELEYSIYFRNGTHGPWILMKDKLKDPTYDWETRSVGDGRYEIKVEASDVAANPPAAGKVASRVSDPVVIDNTAPVVGDVKTEVAGADATISLKVVDRTTTVARLEYSIDSSTDWQSVLPSDKIADSPEEAYQFVVSKLTNGTHQITVRASDAKGNRAYESMTVSVEKK
jgi:hypothetical protein